MHRDFDPDDNFGNGSSGDGLDIDADAMTAEALVWQMLLLVNPDDEETALRQFAAYRELARDEDDVEEMRLGHLIEVTDWTSGFRVHAADTAALIDNLQQLFARWNLRIDWGVEDVDDEDFLAATDVPALLSIAHDRLREHGYALWACSPEDGVDAGWITLRQDEDAMRLIAAELGFDLRAGNEVA